jgi:hypothetical protein
MHRALRYLVLRRLRNRIRQWLAKLGTIPGFVGGIVIALIVFGMLFVGGFRDLAVPDRQAIFMMLLGFLLYSGMLSGLGQRGLIYAPADLDFLFPGPFSRRDLVLYQFTTQYLVSAILSFVYLFVFGGRQFPYPALFWLGAFLCQVTTSHLATAAAEISMLLADRVFQRLRSVTVVLLIGVTVTAVVLVIGGIAGFGDVPRRLREALDGDVQRILLYPAVQATTLGVTHDALTRMLALSGLTVCVLVSFLVVLWIPADIVEGSYASSRRMQKKKDEMRRGVFTAKTARSRAAPTGRLFRGAGAAIWLNWMTLRRQPRVVIGGLLMVVMILAIVGTRDGGSSGQTGTTLMVLLAMVPLWMHLPIGFRLPREQLAAMRELPVRPTPLAASLLVVSAAVPLLLQAVGVALLVATGALPAALALFMLPLYVASTATLLTIDGMFGLRKEHPTAVNVLHMLAQFMLQGLALVPGAVTAVGLVFATGSREIGLLAGTAVQGLVAYALLVSLGSQFQDRELRGQPA